MNKIIAVIPARGGSKSIPKKNIYPILGKPLIAWTIETALKSKLIDRVIVSTDSKEIANVALQYGAEVPFIRPAGISGDKSTDFEVFYHVVNYLQEKEGTNPQMLVHLRPTGPARDVKIINQAIRKMIKDKSYDSLRSISLAMQTPYKMWFLEKESMIPVKVLKENIESHSLARQMLPKAYWQNGYVDIVRPNTIMKKKSMVGKKVLSHIIYSPVCEIDYYDDIKIVENELKNLLLNKKTKVNRDKYPT